MRVFDREKTLKDGRDTRGRPVRRLTVAGFSYLDRTASLEDGSARVNGLDYVYQVLNSPELGERFYRGDEFDVGEMWAASYLCDVARNRAAFVAVPVFPSRTFRHGFAFVREDSGIETPRDLEGKQVGVVEYVQTAAVWFRGALQEQYGVDLTKIAWIETGRRTHAPIEIPAVINHRRANDSRDLEQLLIDGDIDAAIGALEPRKFIGQPIKRLFPNWKAQEVEYYRQTGVLPIMHILGIRREVYDSDPSIAVKLMTLFDIGKQRGYERLSHVSAPAVALPWLAQYLEETEAVLGPDPFPYGLKANRTAVETLCRYLVEQGLVNRVLAATELFVPETLDS